MPNTNREVLISGASIAGPTLAYWLTHYGFRVTVVEQAPRLREGGTPIDVRTHASNIADRMGITPQLRRADLDTEGLAFVDSAGAEKARIRLRATREVTGSAEYELPRGELARILYDASSSNTEYLFDESIESLEQDDNGVDVRFRSGPARRFDLVIGADGTHSGTRRLAFGDETQFLQYLDHYAAVIPVEAALGREYWGLVYNSPGKMACIYAPRGRSDALLLFRQPQRLRYNHHDLLQQKRFVAEAFAGESWHIPRLLEILMDSDDVYFDSVSRVRMPQWSRGRVSLVGDAAHGLPLFGDGSSRAMIGAYLLAGELASTGGDHRAAFARYEQQHRPRVEAIHNAIRSATDLLVPDTAAGIRRRNLLCQLSRLVPTAEWMRRWTKRNNAGVLPDYRAAPHREAA